MTTAVVFDGRTDWKPKDVWTIQGLDTGPKLWMFGASGTTHDISALWSDGFVVASEVELHLFYHSVSLEEEGICFFK